MNLSQCILATLCVLLAAHASNALRCYVCNSVIDDDCADNPAKKYIYNCTENPFPKQLDPKGGYGTNDTALTSIVPEKQELKDSIDFTLCKKAYQDVNGTVRVYRACGWIAHKKDCYYTASYDVKNTVCQCSEDECNTAPLSANVSFAAVIFLSLLSIVLIHN